MPTARALPTGMVLFSGPRTNPPVPAKAMVYSAMNADWSALEPVQGEYDFSIITNALAYAQTHNLPGDIRIMVGNSAPGWLKTLVGTVEVDDPQDNTTDQCPMFWKPAYATAYRALHTALATEFAANPLVRTVGHTMPMTKYAEPFMRGGPASRTRLKAAGLSDAVDLATHKAGIDILRDVWWTPHGVRVRIAINPWHSMDDIPNSSVSRLTQVLDYAIAQLTKNGVIVQNNSIRWVNGAPLGGKYTDLYALMRLYKANGVPIGFQTAADSRIGDVQKTLQWAVSQGAHWVEPGPGVWNQSATFLNGISAGLAANGVNPRIAVLQTQLKTVKAQIVVAQNTVTSLQAQRTAIINELATLGVTAT